VIKLHFHADCDGVVSAFFVSKELDRFCRYSLHPSLGATVELRGEAIALDISKVDARGKWNLVIDHHVSRRPGCFYSNPRSAGFEWPVSFLSYLLFGARKESWIAAIGVVGDWCADRVPAGFWDVVKEEYPELVPEVDNRVLTHHKIGEMILMLESVISVERSKGALYALEALKSARGWRQFYEGKGKARKLKKTKAVVLGELDRVFGNEQVTPGYALLRFSSPYRIKSLVAGRAKDEYPDRMVVVAQDEEDKVRLSFRNADALDRLVPELTKGIGEGGGHPRASGGWVWKDKWDVFEARLKKLGKS